VIAAWPELDDNVIGIRGAREHNLKEVSLTIPRDKFVVITGVSGSGKSTLAFDLLFAEGQRRFLDAMNTHARQYVEQMSKPDVDLITGLPPTVSIEQRNSRGGGKSTVATVTEIHHFLRLLFARLGTPHCPDCQLPVQPQTRDALVQQLGKEARARGELTLLAPVVKNRKGFHTDVAEWAVKHGYTHLRADGKLVEATAGIRLDRFREHNVEVAIGKVRSGRIGLKSDKEQPPEQLIDTALELGGHTMLALDEAGHVSVHSTQRVCPGCGTSFELLDPKMFSYNSAQGWCPNCRGFGELFYLPDVERGARADAIEESWFEWQEGKREPCGDCKGTRLNPIARAVRLKLDGVKDAPTIVQFGENSVGEALAHFEKLSVRGRDAEIARDILPEVRERLKFLKEVGLEYLQLSRSVTTLSGGEAQRIRLAAQLGSNLSGVLYVLDEPTIGLHSRDNEKLLHALSLLRQRGNSLVVVEHDEETMRRADYIIDLGPGAGVNGGTVVAAGTLDELTANPNSITGRELAMKRVFPSRGARRPVKIPINGKASKSTTPVLELRHARVHNLKDVTVQFPLGRFVAVTGVSGSGKSTLIRECLVPAVQARLSKKAPVHDQLAVEVRGVDRLKAIYEVDQTPIGRTPRSTPATYVGFLDDIRQLFSQTPTARMRGYGPGRFSFNSAQGRCPECEGAGVIKLEMNFMPAAYVTCETCGGCRFNAETLDVLYRDRNIAQVLDLSVAEAIDFFAPVPKVHRALSALRDTGLDYIKLGQVSPTLSGGEAQRIKLVTHLLTGLREQPLLFEQSNSKRNLFVLEEPTIGLHGSDVRRLIDVLQRLVDSGHSVIVIEHHLDLIAEADWVIDLGPEGGDEGGQIVCAGTPEQIAANKRSHTGAYLRALVA